MSIEPSELASLLTILSEENTSSQNLEVLANNFHQFFGKSDFFKLGCALVALLQNKDLIMHPSQRIACIFFLYDMYRNDPLAVNPFATVFTALINPSKEDKNLKDFNWNLSKLTQQEKYFVYQLITSPSKEVLKNLSKNIKLFKKTAVQILHDAGNLNVGDFSVLQVSIAEKLSELPYMSKIGISCLLNDIEASVYGSDESSQKNEFEEQSIITEALLIGHDAPFKKCFKPEFIRLAPPLHICQDELIWLDENNFSPDFVWDNTILNSTNNSLNITEIRKLMVKACKTQLTIPETKNLESNLMQDSSLILHLDLSPSKFSNLVEYNPSIAVMSLLSFQGKESNGLSAYLDELFKIKMSVHSLEVVNNLANKVILPDEFIHLYISNCIAKCENMNDEKQLQHRLVRLLCAFIQNLIRSKIIDAADLQVELKPFCIEFSAIREANQLYRTLLS